MAVNGKIEIRPMMYLALSYDHRTDLDLAIYRHGPLLNRVHPENSALGRIQYRRAEQRSIRAPV